MTMDERKRQKQILKSESLMTDQRKIGYGCKSWRGMNSFRENVEIGIQRKLRNDEMENPRHQMRGDQMTAKNQSPTIADLK
jgi:ribosomal protein L15E